MEIGTNLAEHKYMFAIPAYDGKLCVETALSCLGTAGKLAKAGVPHCFNIVKGGALIDAVRNEIVHRFLNEGDCDTLICVDADIEWEWAALERLLVFSGHYPIVAGAYCGRVEPPKFIVNALDNKLNEHGLLPINGLGMGFVAIQRQVFDKLKEVTPVYRDESRERDMHAFFRTGQISEKGTYIGEDVWFFKQAVKAGFVPMLDPGIELKHHGSKCFDYQIKDYMDQLLGDKNGIQNS